MREPTIARNYAEALFESGEAGGQTERYARLIEAVAGAIEADNEIKVVLDSPRVSKPQKQEILAKALKGRAPEPFIRFLSAVVKRGRQGMLGPALGRRGQTQGSVIEVRLGYARPPLGHSTGLIEHDRGDSSGQFQRVGFLDENSQFGPATAGYQNRGRSR